MAIAEVKALVDMLAMAAKFAERITTRYYQASEEMKAFPGKVKILMELKTEWAELLEKHPLPSDCHVKSRLDAAASRLEQEVARMEQINPCCCVPLWNKLAFPEELTSNMNAVIEAFNDLPKYLEEKKEREKLLEAASERVVAPFSFSFDAKYVPLEETVREVRSALQDDSSPHNVVLLHGESGKGKTTMAKYLALLYWREYSEKRTSSGCSTSSEDGYFHGIHFIECGEKADSRFLMQNLWKDLGYSSGVDSGDVLLDVAKPEERAETPDQQRKSEVQYTKRRMMARLKARGKMLIILENVWEQEVIEDLHVSDQHIRYLITSQNSDIWPDVIRSVRVATPTVEEARRILANHIPGWDLNESFPPEVQEVDALLEEVNREPFILASLASTVWGGSEPKKPKLWKSLRRNLMVCLTELQNAKSKPMTFGESYKTDVAAAVNMAVTGFLPHTQILLFLVVLFTEDVPEIEEPVLQVLFQAYHGRNSFLYMQSSHQLKASSFISVNETVLSWRKQPFTRWSIHDLRRRFVGGMQQIDAVVQKLLWSEQERDPRTKIRRQRSDDEDEDHLSMALCYLYGNQHCREQAKLRLAESRFSICKQLQRGVGHKPWLNCICEELGCAPLAGARR
ncbi:hypothetical protein Mapa_011269 [Marchantia paleacea]|nr:hypothetical protein Mapa_011269 [Marchantia paleacea]